MLLDGIPFVDLTLKVGHHAGGSLTGTIVEARNGSQTRMSAVTAGSL
jgi:MFS superfamily sulfate permease-like transporter